MVKGHAGDAQSVVPERGTLERYNPLARLHLAEGRRFFRESPSPIRRWALLRKCRHHVYLRVRGEVAEWPKAAVC